MQADSTIPILLSADEIPDIGEELFNLPLDVLYVDTRDEVIVLEIDKLTLENALGLNKLLALRGSRKMFRPSMPAIPMHITSPR